MEILVVCGAGASSTFVALRIRRAASARGLDITARAGSIELMGSALAESSPGGSASALSGTSGVDLVLVGPHLASRLEDIRAEALAADARVRVALLPESAVGSLDGDLALQTALDAAGVGS